MLPRCAVRVLGITGSPRHGGNTEQLLNEVMKGAASKGAETKIIFLNTLKVKPCQECGGCDKTGECIVKDDMQMVYEELRQADRIVLASPLFFMGVTAQLKGMMDRCQALWVRKYRLKTPPLVEKKERKGLFISVGGRDVPHLFDGALQAVDSWFAVLNIKRAGNLLYPGIDDKGDILKHPEALQEAFEAGEKLVEDA